MPAKKIPSKPETATAAVTPVPTPAATDAAKVVKKAKTTKSDAPVGTPVAAPALAVEVAEGGEDGALAEQSAEFINKLQQVGTLLSSLKTEYRNLERKWLKELKLAQKASCKRKRKAGSRAPSGFVKPTKVSDELATFLGKPKGTEMARTDVTREINTYIRANKLQDKDNGRQINADKKLSTLLKLKEGDPPLSYFNLQKFLSQHFPKSAAATTA